MRAAHPEIERLRLLVTRGADGEARDVMTLRATLREGADATALASALEGSLKRESGLGGTVEIVDALPADGIVVEDLRDYGDG